MSEHKMEYVPEAEIRARIGNFQNALSSKDLDGAFVLQNVDLYYLTGTLQRSTLFVPREGPPLLMVMKSAPRARRESPLAEVIPIANRDEVWTVLQDYGHGGFRKIGLELDVLPAQQYLWFRKKLGEALLTDISHDIRRQRMIKSPYEVEQIRRAAVILDKGLREIRSFIREGMTELEVDGYLAYIARREGHMGYLRMRGWNQEMTHAHVLSGETGAMVSFCDTPAGGSGNTPAMAQGGCFKRIRKDEPICIDYGVAVNGYVGDQTRTFVIGDLPDDLARALSCSKAILEQFEADARPGASCGGLFEAAEQLARETGFHDNFMGYGEGKVKFLGHGIGLEIDELPVVTPWSKKNLEPGMVVAVEPKFIFPGQGIVGMEDDFLVTESGLERITLTDQELLRVPT